MTLSDRYFDRSRWHDAELHVKFQGLWTSWMSEIFYRVLLMFCGVVSSWNIDLWKMFPEFRLVTQTSKNVNVVLSWNSREVGVLDGVEGTLKTVFLVSTVDIIAPSWFSCCVSLMSVISKVRAACRISSFLCFVKLIYISLTFIKFLRIFCFFLVCVHQSFGASIHPRVW